MEVTEVEMDDEGTATKTQYGEPRDGSSTVHEDGGKPDADGPKIGPVIIDPPSDETRKYYVDGGSVEVVADLIYELDADGKQLRVVKLTDYTAEKVREIFNSADDLRSKWISAEQRAVIIEALEQRGISLEQLSEAVKNPEADPFDLLCHLAFNAPLLTRRERVEKLKKNKQDFFDQYGPEARMILKELLQKYAEHGVNQLFDKNIFRMPPISDHGTIIQIAGYFGGADKLRNAIDELQNLLYAS